MTWSDDRNVTQARILLDSISPADTRLTTFEVTLHRWVLAELNTHRVFSRNSESSRAVPVHKKIERVKKWPAMSLSWPREQKGMQGGDELEGHDLWLAKQAWLMARDAAVAAAEAEVGLGLHKGHANRLLEPFMWHTVIISATDLDGFWKQRCDAAAQPEIRVAAEMMREAYLHSEPTLVGPREWHTPLIQPEEDQAFWEDMAATFDLRHPELRKRVSTARCARVSYLTHDGRRDIAADLTLYERLITMGHWSPLEHVATPFVQRRDGRKHFGNFQGWSQHRHEAEFA